MAGGVTGWDLYSTLALQAEYLQYYASVPPVACPNDGEPLERDPRGKLRCAYDGWVYES